MKILKYIFLTGLLLVSTSALATTYCHVETGQCLDPQLNNSQADYLARYAAQIEVGWIVAMAPDGTLNNAAATPTGGGNYTYVNPPVPPTILIPSVLTKAEFQQYAYATLGAVDDPTGNAQQQLLAGIVRFGAIQLAMKGSSDPGTAAAFDGYNNNTSFTLQYVTTFLSLIGPSPGSAITTSAENAAFLANWPAQ